MTQRGLLLALIAIFAVLMILVSGIILLIMRAQNRRRLNRRLSQLSSQPQDLDETVEYRPISRSAADKRHAIWVRLCHFMHYDAHLRPWGALAPRAMFTATGAMALLVGAIAAHVIGPPGWLLSLPAYPFLVRFYLGYCLRRTNLKLFEQFPDALGMITRGVRVGVPISQSIRNVALDSAEPTASQFAVMADQINIGTTLATALRELSERNSLPEYKFFATALTLQAQTGGSISETLDNLADTIRKRCAARNRGKALASEAKMSMYVLAALPIIMLVLMLVINHGYMAPLLQERLGTYIMATAATFWSIGMLSMRFLVNKALS